jgi:hypothetical protein
MNQDAMAAAKRATARRLVSKHIASLKSLLADAKRKSANQTPAWNASQEIVDALELVLNLSLPTETPNEKLLYAAKAVRDGWGTT